MRVNFCPTKRSSESRCLAAPPGLKPSAVAWGLQAVAAMALLMAVVLAATPAGAAQPDPQSSLMLYTRSRPQDPDQPGSLKIVYQTVTWEAPKTAVIICDMWARHWCEGACRRGAEMAPRMNPFVAEARRRGALVIHAPSGGMDLYADHAARKRAQNAPKAANLPDGIAGWCREME